MTPDDGVLLSLWRGEIKVSFGRVSKVGDLTRMLDIAIAVATEHGFSVEALRAPDGSPGARRRPLAYARQEAMWRMMQCGKWSTTRVGIFLGGRDHQTVIHGVKGHQARLDAMRLEAAA